MRKSNKKFLHFFLLAFSVLSFIFRSTYLVNADLALESFVASSGNPSQLNYTPTQTTPQINITSPLAPSVSPSRTFINTITPTNDHTATRTTTSRFSFLTNTPTTTNTSSPKKSQTSTQQLVLDFTITPENSRTFEIISYNSPMSTKTIEVEEINPYKEGFIGFSVTFLIGLLIILVLIFINKR